MILAREWQRLLETGGFSSKAELSRTLGISRARVTQILRVLKLDSEVLTKIASLGDPLTAPTVTERSLRPIIDLPVLLQRQLIDKIASDPRR